MVRTFRLPVFFVSCGLLLLGTELSAQGGAQGGQSPSPVSPGLVQKKFYDEEIDSWWKVNDPAGPSDWFNVDFDASAKSCIALGICLDIWDTIGSGGLFPALGLYPESTVFASAPDIASPVTEFSAKVTAGDGFGDLVQYDLPCIHLGGTDLHVAGQWRNGDTATWIGADSNGVLFNNSFATSDAFATGALPAGFNWAVGLATDGGNSGGNVFLVNGAAAATVDVGETVALTFWGCASRQVTQLRLFNIPILPVALTTTGGVLAGPKKDTWEIQFTPTCEFVVGAITFTVLYQDCPSGVGLAGPAHLVVDPIDICAGCYGIQDDGNHEGAVWRVQNPAGPSDWMNVNHGMASALSGAGRPGTLMTSMEVGLSEFCGVATSWATVGEFLANLPLDPSGGTPDLTSGVSIHNAPIVAGQTHDGGYPATTYDLPDLAINTTDIYHAAVRWASGDSCVWIASDTDGTDDPCGQPLPNLFSLVSTDSYATAAIPANVANWALKLNWR